MRVLCLGNNTEDTDVRTRQLADTVCHGLLSELDGPLPELLDGWYHSSVYDIEYGSLIKLAQQFDRVLMLDQSKSQYSHPDAFYKTVRLIKSLPNGKFLDSNYATEINFFEELVNTNKSFCIFPFIELLTYNSNTTVCCRSIEPITPIKKLKDFKTDPNYQAIREKMLQGELVPEHCSFCYKLEAQNVLSARQQETVEWANRLNLTSLEDLDTITKPAYFEVRPSNICNLQCRMCRPSNSNLIAREYQKLKLISDYEEFEYSNFDIIEFDNIKKLYVAGGEPTAMTQFYDFLDRCISTNNTDFEFVINTNAVKISNKFKDKAKQFSNMQFIISIDGLDELNYYIRWPTEWNTLIDNVQYLQQHHVISFNVTVSIYNVTRLFDLLEFFDCKFPGVLVHCQYADSTNDILSSMNFPNNESALKNLLPIRSLKCYNNDPLLASTIEGLINYYEKNPATDIDRLRQFFEFNDKLDGSRNVKLINFIPELEEARKLL